MVAHQRRLARVEALKVRLLPLMLMLLLVLFLLLQVLQLHFPLVICPSNCNPEGPRCPADTTGVPLLAEKAEGKAGCGGDPAEPHRWWCLNAGQRAYLDDKDRRFQQRQRSKDPPWPVRFLLRLLPRSPSSSSLGYGHAERSRGDPEAFSWVAGGNDEIKI